MSFGNSSSIVDECRTINGFRVGRRRRNAMANIFSGIDRAVLRRNGWASCGNDGNSVEETNTPNELSETEETSAQDSEIPNSPSKPLENVKSSHSRSSEFSNLCHSEGSDIELEQILDNSTNSSFCELTVSGEQRVERSISIGSVYQLWEQLESKRRRNASPHVLDTISNSQLQILKDMFVSTVHVNTNNHNTRLMCN